MAGRLFQAKHLLVASGDPYEIEDHCGRALRPHRLLLRNRMTTLDARLHHFPIGPLSLSRLCYGGDVTVVPTVPEEGNFLISLPLGGSAHFSHGTLSADLTPGHGAIVGPYRECELDIGRTFDQLLVHLSRHRVEMACADLAGKEKVEAVHFELPLNNVPDFWNKILEATATLSLLGDTGLHPKLFSHIEQLVIDSLLLTQPHNFSSAISASGRPAHSALVRRAMAYMHEHMGEPLRVGLVARQCGVSVRSLQAGFQREVGLAPSDWLRAERLDRVYAALSEAQPGTAGVTDIALQWGFVHLSDFAAHFRKRFGEKPSQVLSRRYS